MKTVSCYKLKIFTNGYVSFFAEMVQIEISIRGKSLNRFFCPKSAKIWQQQTAYIQVTHVISKYVRLLDLCVIASLFVEENNVSQSLR